MNKLYYIEITNQHYEDFKFYLESLENIIIYDGELTEEEIDLELGELSYCGGDLEEKSIERLEDLLSKKKKKIYFKNESEAQKFQLLIKEENNEIIEIFKSEEKNWSEEWKKHYEKIHLGYKDLIIVPSWEKKENKKSEIYIYPGQGFGTGTHETTRLCLKILKGLENKKVDKILDFGCGSGILGIGHHKLLNSHCVYYDIEKAAIENTLINLELNEVDESYYQCLNPSQKNLIKDHKYDLIFANILKHVILAESDFLNSLECNTLILSGILVGQEIEIIDHFKKINYKNNLMMVDGDWVSLLMEKN